MVHFFNEGDVAARRKLYGDVRDLAFTQLTKQSVLIIIFLEIFR